jgi:5-methylthioadenosine/S-adenosylhomocysteine deaminase
MAPVRELAAAQVPLGLGSDAVSVGNRQDLWSEIKLLGLLSQYEDSNGTAGRELGLRRAVWDALVAATTGGAKALGLDREIGTLENGKWADICCIDLGDPGVQPLAHPFETLVVDGARELVTDVWVDGRQLLSKGQFTRLDWPGSPYDGRTAARAEGV